MPVDVIDTNELMLKYKEQDVTLRNQIVCNMKAWLNISLLEKLIS